MGVPSSGTSGGKAMVAAGSGLSPGVPGAPPPPLLLSELNIQLDGMAEDDHRSSTSASDRGGAFGNSGNSSLQSSRGPTRGGRAGAQPPAAALQGLKGRRNMAPHSARRAGSAESRDGANSNGSGSSRPHSHNKPPLAPPGAPAGVVRGAPMQKVKRFKPPARSTTPIVQVGGGGKGVGGVELPPIGISGQATAQASAVQLASARAAAAARQPQRVQALQGAYGIEANRPNRRPANLPPGNRLRHPQQIPKRLPTVPGNRLGPAGGGVRPPPAAPSQKMAARLGARNNVVPGVTYSGNFT